MSNGDLTPSMRKFYDDLRAYEEWFSTMQSSVNRDLAKLDEWDRLMSKTPHYNMIERDSHFEYNFDVPGVRKEDIHVDENNGMLTITGKRDIEKHNKNDRYSHRETQHGEFSRSVKLAKRCRVDDIKAELVNGVLTVRIGKVVSNVRKIYIN